MLSSLFGKQGVGHLMWRENILSCEARAPREESVHVPLGEKYETENMLCLKEYLVNYTAYFLHQTK